jgi:hypothetical protein
LTFETNKYILLAEDNRHAVFKKEPFQIAQNRSFTTLHKNGFMIFKPTASATQEGIAVFLRKVFNQSSRINLKTKINHV